MDHANHNAPHVADVIQSALDSAKSLITIARPTQRESQTIMGGTFSALAVGAPEGTAKSMIELLTRLETLWSRFLNNSEISRLNHSEGKALTVSVETIALVDALIDGWKSTNGVFDPTTLPLTLAHGFNTSRIDESKRTSLPPSAQWPGDVAGIKIDRTAMTVALPLGTTLDAGGMGKGLAADMAVAYAMSQGAEGAMVSANGDVVVDGASPDGNSWRIGIEHPLDHESHIAQVRLTKGAVVTSSRSIQAWEYQGKKQHHLIDVGTGEAAATEILSATVIAATGASAEAQAKLPFMMDLEKAFTLITSLGSEVAAVDEHMMMHTSTGWERYL